MMNKAMVNYSKVALTRHPDYENRLIEDMGHSLSFLVMGVLEAKTDEFEGRIKKLENLFFFVQEEKKLWNATDNTHEILDQAKGSRGHIWEACQQVPFSQLLYLTGQKKMKTANPNMKAYLQAGYCIIGFWMDKVLQEHYRFSLEKRKQFFRYLNDWIDSYQKGYLSNDGIKQQYIEDLGYDLERGEKVG